MADALTTEELRAQEAVRGQGLCGAVGHGRVCIRFPHTGPHGFEPEPAAYQVISEALAAPSLLDDPATARVSPEERRANTASVVYWALFDAGLLRDDGGV